MSSLRTTTSRIATHGRGFWILDDITPLRQLDDKALAGKAFLFEPELAYRVHWDMYTDTPLPPDEPAGQNPPDGAIINYYLGAGSLRRCEARDLRQRRKAGARLLQH